MGPSSSWLIVCASVLALAACGGGGGSGAPAVTMVTVTPQGAVMVGQQLQLAATVTYANGNTSAGPVTWSSGNTTIASVDATGLVIGLALGQVAITATSEGKSGSAAIIITTGIHFVDVSAGDNHTCGGTAQGVAYCWGDNSSGQLGNGTTTISATPVPVAGGIIFGGPISAGGKHTCGVTPMGVAYCWGDNSSGQLGNGSTTSSATPVLVGGLNFGTVSAGTNHTCGVTSARVAYCWGDNSAGQLGNGTLTNSSVPVVVSAGPGWFQLSAGSNHTCGLLDVAIGPFPLAAYCWGDNSAGQLGNGTTINSPTPVAIPHVPISFYVETVSAGKLYTCGIGLNFGYCWGNNTSGQLGNGTMSNSAIPVSIAGGSVMPNASTMSAGANHACAVASPNLNPLFPGYCWGDNSYGQLGNGTTANSAIPVAVTGGLNFGNGLDGISVSAGGRHTCGVAYAPNAALGAAYCWGDNTFGQLGNNWITSSSVPVNVPGPQ